MLPMQSQCPAAGDQAVFTLFRVWVLSQVHHHIAETICDRRPLLQCARVVTWLEALFCKSQEYRAEQEQGTAALNEFKQIP